MPRLNLEEGTIPPEVLDDLSVTREDFMEALTRIQPSAKREVRVQAPEVRWEGIGGLEQAQERLKDGRELPLNDPHPFRRLGPLPAKASLPYGPPGTRTPLPTNAGPAEP